MQLWHFLVDTNTFKKREVRKRFLIYFAVVKLKYLLINNNKNKMKTKNLFLRVIIALLISLVCINSNAQLPNTTNVRGVASYSTLRAIQEKQKQMELQNQKFQRLPASAHLRTYMPTTNRAAFHLSKEQLESYYKRANFSIATGDTIVGIKMLCNAAKLGLKDAQFDYGFYCIQGKYVNKNVPLGKHFIQEAAKQNHPTALYYLGEAYYYGDEGFRKDSIESIKWYEKSAKEGFFLGQATLGFLYLNARDTINAVKYWQMAATNKNISYLAETEHQTLGQVYYNLGLFYYNGEGVKHDEATGINYFKEAARYGHVYANYFMGLLYREGTEYTPQDDKIARDYIKTSAINGYAEGEALYGDYCQFGIGMERDSIQSINWYRKAYQDGYTQTAYILAYHYSNTEENDSIIAWGTKPESRDSSNIQFSVGAAYYNKGDYVNAENWWKLSAAQNDPDALWWMYVLNENVKKDSITAFEYLKKAVEGKIPLAINDMGCNYLNGYIVNKDIEKAKALFLEAADSGEAVAYKNLGIIYYWKEYGMKNRKLAAEYWKQGADLGDPDSQYYYGYILKKGHGVKKDKQEAIRWLKLAAQNGSEEAKEELQKMGINVSPQSVLDTSNAVNAIKEEPQPAMKQYRVTGVDFIGVTLEEE